MTGSERDNAGQRPHGLVEAGGAGAAGRRMARDDQAVGEIRLSVAKLKERYRDLARRYDVKSDNATFEKFVGLTGYGLAGAVPPAPTLPPPADEPAAEAEPAPPPPPPLIEGMRLDKTELTPAQTSFALAVVLGLLLVVASGTWRQGRQSFRTSAQNLAGATMRVRP